MLQLETWLKRALGLNQDSQVAQSKDNELKGAQMNITFGFITIVI